MPKKGKQAKDYKYVGTTYDGVKIIAPIMKSKRFTAKQIKANLAEVLKEKTMTNKPKRGDVAVNIHGIHGKITGIFGSVICIKWNIATKSVDYMPEDLKFDIDKGYWNVVSKNGRPIT